MIDMGKRFIISILTFFIGVAAFGAGKARQATLHDGFVMTGIDGKLASTDSNNIWFQDNNDRWFFTLDSELSDDRTVVIAGTKLELLPSATLEKITADVKERSAASYRLWGRITKYKGKNFIFPVYFLPLSKTKKSQSQESQGTHQETGPIINEPNDVLTIPKEIIEKLKARPISRPKQTKKGVGLEKDSILADRTGFIVKQRHGRLIFVLDAFGRNIRQTSLRLLPCQALERAERQQSVEPVLLRFKVAGIVTKYKGKQYLLLQRTTRAYSHGNFGR